MMGIPKVNRMELIAETNEEKKTGDLQEGSEEDLDQRPPPLRLPKGLLINFNVHPRVLLTTTSLIHPPVPG